VRTTLEIAGALVALIGAAFAAFFILDERHAHDVEVHQIKDDLTAEMVRRDWMNKSEYAARAKKYYRDLQEEGVELHEADRLRIEMLDRDQQRAHDVVMSKPKK
jgi:hypothetical protein